MAKKTRGTQDCWHAEKAEMMCGELEIVLADNDVASAGYNEDKVVGTDVLLVEFKLVGVNGGRELLDVGAEEGF